MRRAGIAPQDKDVIVAAQKAVSKAKGRLVDRKTVAWSDCAYRSRQRGKQGCTAG
ncbi:MAG: coenzyme F420-0:L-glutamate ligase [Xanthobacteraceae bacterium]